MQHPLSEPDLRVAMLGVWTVDRRASPGEARFLRVTFYRDGRFGTLAADGRTVVYGDWRVRVAPDGDATLTLGFDHHRGPSAEYHLAMQSPPVGPATLAEIGGHGRYVLARAEPIDASLVGAWFAATPARHEGGVGALELRGDGTFTLRLAGGVARAGRWSFLATQAGYNAPLVGRLTLDPAEVVYPCERWIVSRARDGASLTVATASATARLERRRIDAAAHALEGHWRLAMARTPAAPHELALHPGGAAEVLARPGALRAPGRWWFERTLGRHDALEGRLALAVHPHGHPVARERWRVVLPFARGGDLEFFTDAGQRVLAYRRLFR